MTVVWEFFKVGSPRDSKVQDDAGLIMGSTARIFRIIYLERLV